MSQLSYLSLLVHKKCSKPTINRVQNSTIWALIIELEGHEEEQNPTQKGRKQKKAEQSRDEESEDDKAFISDEAYSFW